MLLKILTVCWAKPKASAWCSRLLIPYLSRLRTVYSAQPRGSLSFPSSMPLPFPCLCPCACHSPCPESPSSFASVFLSDLMHTLSLPLNFLWTSTEHPSTQWLLSFWIPLALHVCTFLLASGCFFCFLSIICFCSSLTICSSRYFIDLYISGVRYDLHTVGFVQIPAHMWEEKYTVLEEFARILLYQVSQFTPNHPFGWTRRGRKSEPTDRPLCFSEKASWLVVEQNSV